MKTQMTIGKKLYLSMGAAVALTLALGAMGVGSINTLGGAIDRLVNVSARKRYLAARSGAGVNDLLALERGILFRAFLKDRATMEQNERDFGTTAAALDKTLQELASLSESAEERGVVEGMERTLEDVKRAHGEMWTEVSAGKMGAAVDVYKARVNMVLQAATKTAEDLETQQNTLIQAQHQEAERIVARSRWTMIALSIFVLAVGGAVVLIVRQINARLRNAVAELTEGAEQVSSAANQIAATSQSLAQGASEQAAALEETSASSEEINSMAVKSTESAQSAAELVMRSQDEFVRTNQALDLMVVAMSEITTQSDKIAKIIKIIDEIAFQTNILALNAAVEAARAGEAGKGFAVVADEVRSLAQRSAQAAKDTATLIEESIAKSNDGKTKVDQVAAAIREITVESAKVKTLVDEISLGSQEQTRGIQEIARSLTQMEQVTQQSAASTEESAASAEELTSQAAALLNVAGTLTTMVGTA